MYQYSEPTLVTRANVYKRDIAQTQDKNMSLPYTQLARSALNGNNYGGHNNFDALRKKGVPQITEKVTHNLIGSNLRYKDQEKKVQVDYRRQPLRKIKDEYKYVTRQQPLTKSKDEYTYVTRNKPLRIKQIPIEVKKYHKLNIKDSELEQLILAKLEVLLRTEVSTMISVDKTYTLQLLSRYMLSAYNQMPKSQIKLRRYFYYFLASIVDILVQTSKDQNLTSGSDSVPHLNKEAIESIFDYTRIYVWNLDQYCWRFHKTDILCTQHSKSLDTFIASMFTTAKYNMVTVKFVRKIVLTDSLNRSIEALWKLIDYRLEDKFSRRSLADITMTYNYQHIITIMKNMKIVLSYADQKLYNLLEKTHETLEKIINQVHKVKKIYGPSAQYFFTQTVQQANASVNFCLYMSRKIQTFNVNSSDESTEINNIVAALSSLKGNFSRPPNSQAQVEWEYDPKLFAPEEEHRESNQPLRIFRDDKKIMKNKINLKYVKEQCQIYIQQLESFSHINQFKTIVIVKEYLKYLIVFADKYDDYVLNIEHFQKFFSMVSFLISGMESVKFTYNYNVSYYLTWMPNHYVAFFWGIRALNIELIRKYKNYFTNDSRARAEILSIFTKFEVHKQTLPLFQGKLYECTEIIMLKKIMDGYDFDVRLNKFVIRRKIEHKLNVDVNMNLNRPETRSVTEKKRTFFFYLQYERLVEQVRLILKNQPQLYKKMQLEQDLADQLTTLGLSIHLTQFSYKLNDYEYLFIKLSDMRSIQTEIIALKKAVIEAVDNQYENSDSLEQLEDLIYSILVEINYLFFHDGRYIVFLKQEQVSYMYPSCTFELQGKVFNCANFVRMMESLKYTIEQYYVIFSMEYAFLETLPIYIQSKIFMENAYKLLFVKNPPSDLMYSLNILVKKFTDFWSTSYVYKGMTESKVPFQFLAFDPQEAELLSEKINEFLDNSLPVEESTYDEDISKKEILMKKALTEISILLQLLNDQGELLEELTPEQLEIKRVKGIKDKVNAFSPEANVLPEEVDDQDETEKIVDIRDEKNAHYNGKNVDDLELDDESSSTNSKNKNKVNIDIHDEKNAKYNGEQIDDFDLYEETSSDKRKQEDPDNISDHSFDSYVISSSDEEDKKLNEDIVDIKNAKYNGKNIDDLEFDDESSSHSDLKKEEQLLDMSVGDIQTGELDSHSSSSNKKKVNPLKPINLNDPQFLIHDIEEDHQESRSSSSNKDKKKLKPKMISEIVNGPMRLKTFEHTIPDELFFDDDEVSPSRNSIVDLEKNSNRDALLNEVKIALLNQLKNPDLQNNKRTVDKVPQIDLDDQEKEESSDKDKMIVPQNSFVSDEEEDIEEVLDNLKDIPDIENKTPQELQKIEKKMDIQVNENKDIPQTPKSKRFNELLKIGFQKLIQKQLDKINQKKPEDELKDSQLDSSVIEEEIIEQLHDIPDIENKSPEKLHDIEDQIDKQIDNKEIIPKTVSPKKFKDLVHEGIQKIIVDNQLLEKNTVESPSKVKEINPLVNGIKKIIIQNLPENLSEDKVIDELEKNSQISELDNSQISELEDDIVTEIKDKEKKADPLKVKQMIDGLRLYFKKIVQGEIKEKKKEEEDVSPQKFDDEPSEDSDKHKTLNSQSIKKLHDDIKELLDSKVDNKDLDGEIIDTIQNSPELRDKTPEDLEEIEDLLNKTIDKDDKIPKKIDPKRVKEILKDTFSVILQKEIKKLEDNKQDEEYLEDLDELDENTTPQDSQLSEVQEKMIGQHSLDLLNTKLKQKKIDLEKEHTKKQELPLDLLESQEKTKVRKIRRVIIIEEMKCTLCVNDQLLTYFIAQLK